MGVDHLQAHISGQNLDPDRAARLPEGRKLTGLDQAGRERGQDRIAVFLFLDMQRRMKMRRDSQMPGDLMRLVDAAGPHAADIQFLERDDVGLCRRNDIGDPQGIGTAAASPATVDVVGQDPEFHAGPAR
jgi:hypothetical protein